MHSLKTLAKQDEPSKVTVTIKDRLPYFIQAPCEVCCEFRVEKKPDYYYLTLRVTATLAMTCQRCLDSFEYAYDHLSELAICPSEEVAEQVMSSLDCMVNTEDDLDLIAIATDELHLFCPEKHENLLECKTLPLQCGS